jgi:hypothetical protein
MVLEKEKKIRVLAVRERTLARQLVPCNVAMAKEGANRENCPKIFSFFESEFISHSGHVWYVVWRNPEYHGLCMARAWNTDTSPRHTLYGLKA